MKSHSIRETDVGKKLIHPHILSHRFSYDKRRGESYMLIQVRTSHPILYSTLIFLKGKIILFTYLYWWTVEFLYI
jgi:hypothetical protein